MQSKASSSMQMNFCRRCGKPLKHSNSHVYVCTNGHTIYANHSPAVGIFFMSPDNQKVLLAIRGVEPHKGMLDAPGGFLDANESFEEGARRELHEELGLEPEDYEPLIYLASDYGAYPYQDEVIPFVSVLFMSRLRSDKTLHPNDDVSDTDWHTLADINLSTLHADDIRTGIRTLQKTLNQEKN